MKPNAALRAWRAHTPSVGLWLSLASTQTAEMLARTGFDWLCVDMQHGLIDFSDMTAILQAVSVAEVTPIVRVPWNEPASIMKALDAGAYGVIVPMVNDRQEAEAAVRACRYPPEGYRSFGPIRAAAVAGVGYANEANSEIACIVMVETAEALANLEAIVTTPGVDAVYVGPSDLGLALGLGPLGDSETPEHLAAVERIRQTCHAHDVPVGIHTGGAAWARRRLEAGFDFVPMGSDLGLLTGAARRDLASLRGSAQQAVERTGY